MQDKHQEDLGKILTKSSIVDDTTIIASLKKNILLIIANWSFVFGMLTATVVFSDYIFGDDNLYEELVEMANCFITKEDVDLSPETPEDPDSELHKMQMIFSQ